MDDIVREGERERNDSAKAINYDSQRLSSVYIIAPQEEAPIGVYFRSVPRNNFGPTNDTGQGQPYWLVPNTKVGLTDPFYSTL